MVNLEIEDVSTKNEKIEEIRAQINAEVDSYVPNEGVLKGLGYSALVQIIGPFTVGKTSTMRGIEAAHSDFSMKRGFTDRPRRPGESDSYIFFDQNEEDLSIILKLLISGDFVNAFIHPDTGYIYGSAPDDYLNKCTVLDTIASEAEAMAALPFKEVTQLGMVAPPEDWWGRVDVRSQFAEGDEIPQYLNEAVSSLEWLLDQGPDLAWVVNRDQKQDKTIQEVVSYARHEIELPPKSREIGELLLKSIKEYKES